MKTFAEAYTTIAVKDTQKAKKFYTEILGFQVAEDYGEHWIGLEGAGIYLGIHSTKEKMKQGNVSIGFTVQDIKKAVEELSKKGIKFSKIKEDEMVKVAHFTDPEGTPLYLCELTY